MAEVRGSFRPLRWPTETPTPFEEEQVLKVSNYSHHITLTLGSSSPSFNLYESVPNGTRDNLACLFECPCSKCAKSFYRR